MLRRAMSKKKVKDIEKERGAFLHGDEPGHQKGCIANGISEERRAGDLRRYLRLRKLRLQQGARRGLRGHCVPDGVFQVPFPKEYMAALTSVLDSSEKIAEYIGECRECAIALLPPDVNRSDDRFTVEPEGIRFGLVAIKNIGRGLITRMMREREVNGPFADFQDFCYRMDGNDMNKRAVRTSSARARSIRWACIRSQLIASTKGHGRHLERQPRECRGQLDFFGMGGGSAQRELLHLPDIPEFPRRSGWRWKGDHRPLSPVTR